MGNGKSVSKKLDKETLEELGRKTNFSDRQIKQWHKAFLLDCPNGQLGRKQCCEVVAETFPPEKASHIANNIFEIFDTDMSGEIDFSEFIVAVNALSSSNNSALTKKLFTVESPGNGAAIATVSNGQQEVELTRL